MNGTEGKGRGSNHSQSFARMSTRCHEATGGSFVVASIHFGQTVQAGCCDSPLKLSVEKSFPAFVPCLLCVRV